MTYLDFIVHLGPDSGSGHTVQVESPAGGGGGHFAPPSGPRPIWRHLQVEAPEGGSEIPLPDPRETGDHLFRTLFAGRVRQLFDQSRGHMLAGQAAGLRIRIRLDPEDSASARLAGLPWELLYQAETRQFLGLSRRTPISRELVVPQPPRSLDFPTPLKILAVTANPKGTVQLDLDRERRLLEEALHHSPTIEAEFLEIATAAELRRALQREPYQVLHFMGHGELDAERDKGVVLFEDQHGGLDAIPGADFADELRDCESLTLVVLNACSTGEWTSGPGDPFAGVATALVLSGLPAVIAMQAPISDPAAIAFSHELYQHLADGDPVDAAVVEGRLGIQRAGRSDGLGPEWATPVLFQRGGSGGNAQLTADRASRPRKRPELRTRGGTRSARSLRARGPGMTKLLATLAGGLALTTGLYLSFPSWTGLLQPSDGGGGGLPGSSTTPVPTTPHINLQSLQKPPYRSGTFSTHVEPPSHSAVDTSGWSPRLEQALADQVASLSLESYPGANASWLVVVAFDKADVAAQTVDGMTMHRCDLRARLDIYHERKPLGSSQPLKATASGFTSDSACDAGLDKLAQQVAGRLQDGLLSS